MGTLGPRHSYDIYFMSPSQIEQAKISAQNLAKSGKYEARDLSHIYRSDFGRQNVPLIPLCVHDSTFEASYAMLWKSFIIWEHIIQPTSQAFTNRVVSREPCLHFYTYQHMSLNTTHIQSWLQIVYIFCIIARSHIEE